MPLQDVRLQRRARLGGDDEQGALRVDQGFEAADLAGVGGVQHQELREPRLGAEGLGQHLGAETGAAHADQEHMGETGRLDLGLERLKGHQVDAAARAGVQPFQPLGFVF